MFSMSSYGPHGVDLAQKLANFINLPISGSLLQGGIDIMDTSGIYSNQAVFNFSLKWYVLAIRPTFKFRRASRCFAENSYSGQITPFTLKRGYSDSD